MDSLSQCFRQRDRFAGLAMQSLIAASMEGPNCAALAKLCKENKLPPHAQIAKMAYEQADAMLEWRDNHPR